MTVQSRGGTGNAVFCDILWATAKMTGESLPKCSSVDNGGQITESASDRESGEFKIDQVLCDPFMFKS